MHLLKTDPITPIKMIGYPSNLKVICKNIMIVNAGGNGKWATPNNSAPKKTNRYLNHFFYFANFTAHFFRIIRQKLFIGFRAN